MMHCTHPASIHTQLHSLYTMEYILTYIQTYIQSSIHTYICMHILQTFLFDALFFWLRFSLASSSSLFDALFALFVCLFLCLTVVAYSALSLCPAAVSLRSLSLSRLLSETCQTGLSYKPKIYIHTKHTHTHICIQRQQHTLICTYRETTIAYSLALTGPMNNQYLNLELEIHTYKHSLPSRRRFHLDTLNTLMAIAAAATLTPTPTPAPPSASIWLLLFLPCSSFRTRAMCYMFALYVCVLTCFSLCFLSSFFRD